MATSGAISSTPGNEAASSLSETEFTALNCSHTWKIKNFRNCWMKPGEKLDSATFSSETDRRIEWCLSLYPIGRNAGCKDNISLYLTLMASHKAEIRVKYKLAIINDEGEASNMHENTEGATLLQEWDDHKPSCGPDEFITRSFLLDTANGLLPDDTLTISCELSAATIIQRTQTSHNDNSCQADRWGSTHVKVVKFSYLWTISNFSFCKQGISESIVSPIFSAETDPGFQWRLELYPNGEDETSREYIAIYLYPATSIQSDVQMKFGIKVVPTNGGKVKVSYDMIKKWKAGDTGGYGYSEFMIRDLLLFKSNELLPQDKLTMYCEFQYTTGAVDISDLKSIKLPTPKRRRVSDDLAVLLENGKFSDVTLVVDGGKKLQAHKNILAARSPVFAAMFEYNPENLNRGEVEITDITYEVLQEIVSFIYSGAAKNVASMTSTLLAAADFYNLEGLKFKCEQELFTQLNIENAAATLILADKYSAKTLKAETVGFINAHWTLVICTQGFKKMSASHPQLMAEIAVKRLLNSN